MRKEKRKRRTNVQWTAIEGGWFAGEKGRSKTETFLRKARQSQKSPLVEGKGSRREIYIQRIFLCRLLGIFNKQQLEGGGMTESQKKGVRREKAGLGREKGKTMGRIGKTKITRTR